jgi:3,4-dihydroxy 2-butanone 4-phosphate synthase/GTP cyclohydrolase II
MNSSTPPFSPIPEILDELRAGRMIVLVDDEDRENEGDLVCAAEKVTPETVNFMLTQGRGVLCLTLTRERCEKLQLHPQSPQNTTPFGTAFTVAIDAHPRFGTTTGVSARDRAITILAAIDERTGPADLLRPGHINPLQARDGGVLVRAGQTEGSVDLARLAGLKPAGVLIEVLNEDGSMARVPQLAAFCARHGIKMCTVASLIEYRLRREALVQRVEEVDLATRYGRFHLVAYRAPGDGEPHLALTVGGIGVRDASGSVSPIDEPVLVRVHSECLTGDVFGSQRCECGEQLDRALRILQQAGRGVLVYLRQEGRGIGLLNKLHAYRLQEQGLDTVEANERLGFPADKRDYGIGAQILRDLGLKRIRILTNNPKKISRLEVYGLEVVEQRPIEIPPTDANRRYLEAKRAKLGHTLKDV